MIALVCDCLDVLYSACDLIGAELNAPEDADQPILGVVGPAAPREVLASLLRDSQFGYAMSGSSNDSNAVASLTVFPKDKDSNANPKDENADAAPPAKRLADFAARAQAAVAAAAAGATTDSSQEAEDIDNADAPSGTVVSRDAEGLCEGPGGSSKPAAEAGGTWGSGSTSRLRPGSGSPTSAARFGSASGGTSAIARAIAEGERSGRRALEILADHSGLAGCKHCRGTGYRGRKAVGELLVLSDETREAIVNRAPVRQLKELAQQSGVRLVRAAALDLVRRGHTTLEEVNRVTVMA